MLMLISNIKEFKKMYLSHINALLELNEFQLTIIRQLNANADDVLTRKTMVEE